MDELVREESKRIEREEGFNDGIEQKTIEVMKFMLDKNMDLKDIADITGKSIEEIKKLI